MAYTGKVVMQCSRRGQITKKFKGSSGAVVRKMFTFQPGPTCTVVRREIVKSGSKKGKR